MSGGYEITKSINYLYQRINIVIYFKESTGGYKYLFIPKEILNTIKPWLKNLGMIYVEGHPCVPSDVTKKEIENLVFTLCPMKMWHVKYEGGECAIRAWDKNHALTIFVSLPWGEIRWERVLEIKEI